MEKSELHSGTNSSAAPRYSISSFFTDPFANVDIVGVFCQTPLPQAALQKPKLSIDSGTACTATPKVFVSSFSLATLIHR